jgi:hypothetical protein
MSKPDTGTVPWGDDVGNPERMWRMARIGDDCWEWLRAKRKGYGAVYVSGKICDAHRLAWTLTNGPIPDGGHVLHTCDNPGCVRPGHLFLGTHADNMGDMGEKGRNGGPRKLTVEQVIEIRRRHKNGASRKELAADYNVGASNLWCVVTNKTWRKV